MKRRIVRIGRISLGAAFLVLGGLGLFLPVLQGVLFLLIGLTLLSTESERARGWLHRLRGYVHQRTREQQLKAGEARHGKRGEGSTG